MTRQQRAVVAALGRGQDFRSAQQLHAQLRASANRIGLTTVYRTLAALADSGQVDVVRSADGEARYRRCSTSGHHHHLVCRDCGRSVEVAGPAVERWAAAVAGRHGFQQVTHTVEMSGICPSCQQRSAALRPERTPAR